PTCTAARDNGVAAATIVMGTTVTPGAFVEVTLNERVAGAGTNTALVDASNNPAAAPQARQANATAPETTAPTISSASGAVGSQTVVVNFSEPAYCTNVVPSAFILTDNDSSTVHPPFTAV